MNTIRSIKCGKTEKGVNKAAFDALLIGSLVKKPKEHDRTMPIALHLSRPLYRGNPDQRARGLAF